MVETFTVHITPYDLDRNTFIYLPDNWQTSGRRYPVIYMFDGHNLFFDSTATFGTCWGLKDYLDAHPNAIVVAPECNHEGNKRLEEYCPYDSDWFDGIHGTGKQYMDWLVNELKPAIDAKYPTLPDRGNTAIGGSSMGGLMSLYAITAYNKVFSKAACLSPSVRICLPQVKAELKKAKLPREQHIQEICRLVKIENVFNRLIANLSKGYKQRVGLAQALVGNPEVVILDEPTVGLDPKQIIEIRNLIRNLGQNHTVILSTHILSEVQAVCDRIIIINEGKIIADEKTENITRVVEDNRRYLAKICGPQREILSAIKGITGIVNVDATGEREGDSYTFEIESERGVDIRKPLFYAMSEHGWPIIGLEAVGMNLEEVFIKIMDADLARRH